MGSTPTQHRFIVWELWPHRLEQSEFSVFHETVFQHLNCDPVFHYETAYFKGKVNYIELACDLLSPNIHGLIFWRNGSRKSKIHQIEGEYLTKGTIYLGSNHSATAFRIYNKAKQLKETGQKTPWDRYTRIEARLRNTGLAPYELLLLENPFPKLEIAFAIDCKKLSPDPQWQQFLDTALEEGSPVAFSSLNKGKRKQYKEWLRSCAVKFWKPQKIMNDFHEVLESIHPKNLLSTSLVMSY